MPESAKPFSSRWILPRRLTLSTGNSCLTYCPTSASLAILLSSASTKILFNGTVGRRICHSRGLRQGDPLSPMLFVPVMGALNALIQRVEDLHLFTPLGGAAIKKRAFLYVDDMVIFIHPAEQDLTLVRSILDLFARASGSHTNVNKCQFPPIRCNDAVLQLISQIFPCQL